MNKFKFKKNKSVQMNVRVSKDMSFQVNQIAKSEDINRTEAIRALLEFAINSYFEDKS